MSQACPEVSVGVTENTLHLLVWSKENLTKMRDHGGDFEYLLCPIFHLVYLNWNTFHLPKGLDVDSGKDKTQICFLAFVLWISVIQSMYNQCILEVEKNDLCLCSEPAGNHVDIGSVLPWENLLALMFCLTPRPGNF